MRRLAVAIGTDSRARIGGKTPFGGASLDSVDRPDALAEPSAFIEVRFGEGLRG